MWAKPERPSGSSLAPTLYQTWTVTLDVAVSRAVKTRRPFGSVRSAKPSGGTTMGPGAASAPATATSPSAMAASTTFSFQGAVAQAETPSIRAAIEAAANRRDFMGTAPDARRTRAREPYQGQNPAHLTES